jgi:hypothetical protein
MKRQPNIIPGDKINLLLESGYKLNKESGFYEKEVEIKLKGKLYKTTIRTVKLASDDTFNFYTCDPSENKENMYIGFLTKGNNPNNLCMPCCFKKRSINW